MNAHSIYEMTLVKNSGHNVGSFCKKKKRRDFETTYTTTNEALGMAAELSSETQETPKRQNRSPSAARAAAMGDDPNAWPPDIGQAEQRWITGREDR